MLSSFQSIEDPLWIYPHDNEALKERIVKEFKIHPVIAQVLVSRGFRSLESIHDYLYSRLPNLLDPFLLPDMQKAADRVVEALSNDESILIYGDNDVDGMTGTALLVEFLRFIGAKVHFFLSNRSMRRQAIIVEALEFALKNECKLLITVDCGITAAQEVEEVAKQGVDVIITDHHEPTGATPQCVATLNPKLNDHSYPNRDLTGVGVAFKLAHAITNLLVSEGTIPPKKIDLKRYLDLVALGTVSDMGALLGENRILVTYGLSQLKKTKRNGLAQLIKVAGLSPSQINTHAIASKIAPRLNSLGRIDDPAKGVELLLVRNVHKAEKMAHELDLNNLERQKIEKIMVDDVENTFHIHPEILKNKAIILDSDWWHPGIIAILSTRISKLYNRPTVVIATDEEIGKGSLRSIPAFPLLEVLKGMSDILLNFGGHDLAAGLTLKRENLDEFRKRFLKAAENVLSPDDVKPKLNIDAHVCFNEITFDFMESLKLLEPSGNANPPPTLYTKAKQAWPPKVIGKHHLKLYLQQGDRMLEGMAFGKASMLSQLKRKDLGEIEVAFQPQINNYQGPSIQLLIRDIKLKS
ncbi:MAG: single-stranded-DNA-specific exonuclease RecJ [Chlamydiia bacterium]|nr:single-stranded-DNA-specific exonuclease RecJ [Chlamydiia bacterium]